jgi:prepilin-type N-terminal cleavage/methylation domain-containing protein
MPILMPTMRHHPTAARGTPPPGGFTLVELVIAVIILSFGVLGLAGTTALVVRQVTLADVNTERAAAQQEVIERLRSTSTSTISTGNTTVGSFTVTWAVTDSSTYGKTVRVITTGPGLSKTSAATTPRLVGTVADTFSFVKLKL